MTEQHKFFVKNKRVNDRMKMVRGAYLTETDVGNMNKATISPVKNTYILDRLERSLIGSQTNGSPMHDPSNLPHSGLT